MNPEGPKTEEARLPLELRVTVEKTDKANPGEEIRFTAVLTNVTAHPVVVFMPGITARADFEPQDADTLRPDDVWTPQVFGRMRSREMRDNFVVLQPGDLYGRTYVWKASGIGVVTFSAAYENTEEARIAGTSSWRGKIVAKEAAPLPIQANVKGGEVEKRK